jgi:hypothetical protein
MTENNSRVVRNSLGMDYESHFAFLPANGASGGILIAINCSVMQIQNPMLINHTILATIVNERYNRFWKMTGLWPTKGFGKANVLERVEIAQVIHPN